MSFVYQIMIPLVHRLFEPEDRRLNGLLVELNHKNKKLCDTQIDGFMHNGKFYIPSGLKWGGFNQTRPALHFSLNDEMAYFLRDEKAVLEERSLITQMLHLLFKGCTNGQQIRDSLPDFLVSYLPHEYKQLPRVQEEAWTIKDNPRALRHYDRVLPKMEVYAAAALLY